MLLEPPLDGGTVAQLLAHRAECLGDRVVTMVSHGVATDRPALMLPRVVVLSS